MRRWPGMQPEAKSAGFFDEFAAATGSQVSRAWFFTACTLSIVVWALTGPIFGFNETWQLVINTGTTIITFLLVALLQNTQDRTTKAINHKLDAIATALAHLVEQDGGHPDCVKQLRDMAGVEMEASK